ncbi:uncharacterized protein BKA78DRAFT_300206 [Phyllosticta capitalensis]|uniref:uncharacterized protein n=1 Tax=Phyllosticta capitalensis TaxID=121624 RepID=UPI003131C28A
MAQSQAASNSENGGPLTQAKTSFSAWLLMSESTDFLCADQPRIPHRREPDKIGAPYISVHTEKWWAIRRYKQDHRNHIGRIMETELGVQLLGDARCDFCKQKDRECWAYSALGRMQIANASEACAHCRAETHRCSLMKREKEIRRKKRRGTGPQERTLKRLAPAPAARPPEPVERPPARNPSRQREVEIIDLGSDSESDGNMKSHIERRKTSGGQDEDGGEAS